MIDTSNEYWVEDRGSRVRELGLSAGSVGVRGAQERGEGQEEGEGVGLSAGSVGSGVRIGEDRRRRGEEAYHQDL